MLKLEWAVVPLGWAVVPLVVLSGGTSWRGGCTARVGIFRLFQAETGLGAVLPLGGAVVPLVSGKFADRIGARFWGGNG